MLTQAVKDYFKDMANKRWAVEKKKYTKKQISDRMKLVRKGKKVAKV